MEEALKLPVNFLSLSIPHKLLGFFLLPDPPIVLEVSALVSGFMIFISCCSMFSGVSEFSDRLSGGVLF